MTDIDFSGSDNITEDSRTSMDSFDEALGMPEQGTQTQQLEPELPPAPEGEPILADDGSIFIPTTALTQDTASQQQAPSQQQKPKPETQKLAGKFESVEDLEKAYQNLQRDYTQKSQALGELKPVMPIIDAMMKDENLVTHVENYFNEGDSQQAKDDLGLGDDFHFDTEDAMNNPDSDSAKALQSMVQKQVQQQVSAQAKAQADAVRRQSEEAQFMREHNMSQEQFDAMMDKANKHTLSLNDIHYLLNRDSIEANNQRVGQNAVVNQMRKAQQMGSTVASSGSEAPEAPKSAEDVFMDWMTTEEKGDNFFAS